MSNTPSKEEVRWCSACGEGVTFFCRSKIDCVCPQALVRPASSSTPSDTEIEALAEEYLQAFAQFPLSGKVWCEGEVEFARAVLAKWGTPQPVVREPQCWCLTCRPMRLDDPESIRMALCPTCGNKRCPKANDHKNQCTNSNAPGQKGSAYEACGITQKGGSNVPTA